MRSCIIGPWLLRRREGDVVVTGVLPALDALKQFAATVRGDSERGPWRRARLRKTLSSALVLGSFLFERGIYRFPARAARARRWGQPCAKRRPTSKRRATQARNRVREPGPCCGQAPNKVVDHFVNWRMRARDKRRRISGTKELSHARSFAHRHRGRAALERRLDRAKNRRRAGWGLRSRSVRHLGLRGGAR